MYKYNPNAKKHNNVNQTKLDLINQVYNILDISRFKFEILKYDNELNKLLETKYHVSPNYAGNNYFLVFMKIRDKYIQCLIDRRTLTYNKSKLDINKVNIINTSIKTDLSIYSNKGTIFDGIYINNKGERIFHITDALYLKGVNMCDMKLDSKLNEIKLYLANNYSAGSNDIILTLNKIYKLYDIENVMNTKNSDYIIKGLVFYPEISGTKLIYLYNNSSTVAKDNIIKKTESNNVSDEIKKNSDTPPFSDNKNNDQQLYVPKEDRLYTFNIEKTDISDIYKLHAVKNDTKNGKRVLKKVKIGIAYIKTRESSDFCNKITSDKNSCLVKCKFIESKNKWEPIELDTVNKRPEMIDNFIVN